MINKKIGLFFGTFDPIHNGHIEVAKYILDNYFSDEVWLVITPQNPEKKFIKISNFSHRYKMAQIATKKLIKLNLANQSKIYQYLTTLLIPLIIFQKNLKALNLVL